MPHIVIKTLSGKSPQMLQDAAEQVAVAVNKSMTVGMEHISVSVEEYTRAEWPGVYNECIKDNDAVVIKPGYSDPVTFE